MQTLKATPVRASATASARRVQRAAVVVASAKPDVPKVTRRAAAVGGLLSGFGLMALGSGQAKAVDSLGEALEELEEIEPIVAEDLKKIDEVAGKEELKEIIADVKDVEGALETLERKSESVGGETAFEDAAAPLKQRLKELNDLIALFGK